MCRVRHQTNTTYEEPNSKAIQLYKESGERNLHAVSGIYDIRWHMIRDSINEAQSGRKNHSDQQIVTREEE